VLGQLDPLADLAQHPHEGLAAVHPGASTKVVAVDLEQVEGVKEHLGGAPAGQRYAQGSKSETPAESHTTASPSMVADLTGT